MNTKRLFAFDLDGTICGENRVIPDRTVDSLRSIRSNGDAVMFVTGRRQIDMNVMGAQVLEADYAAINNGAFVFDTRTQRTLIHRMVPENEARTLVEACLNRDVTIDVITKEEWWTSRLIESDLSYGAKIGKIPHVFHTSAEIDLTEVEAFMIAEEAQVVQSIIQLNHLGLQCIESEPRCSDIMAANAGKWRAVRAVADEEHIHLADTVAIGNYSNDIEMISNAGIGFAVSDALPSVRAAADIVLCSSWFENPVAEVAQIMSDR